jgi:hypothetical protein
MFIVEVGNQWQVFQGAEVVKLAPGEFVATFEKPRLGPIPPPAPRVRYKGQEAIATAWQSWPEEPRGKVTLYFRLE